MPYAHANANGTFPVVTFPGKLRGVTVNTKGASSNTLTLYEGNTAAVTAETAPVIAVIDTTANVGTLFYDVVTMAGVTGVLATGTAADVTVVVE
jgi:hypothetical protein